MNKFTIAWRYFPKDGKWWVEETIGDGGTNKVLYGPVPDRVTVDALIEERKAMLQKIYVDHAKRMSEHLNKSRLVVAA